jgi:hypothetical protein
MAQILVIPRTNRCSTPVSLIHKINEDIPKMLLLFEDCIDFSEGTSDARGGMLILQHTRLIVNNELIYDMLFTLFRMIRQEPPKFRKDSSFIFCLLIAIQRSDIRGVRRILDIYPSAAEGLHKSRGHSHICLLATVEIMQLLISKGLILAQFASARH